LANIASELRSIIVCSYIAGSCRLPPLLVAGPPGGRHRDRIQSEEADLIRTRAAAQVITVGHPMQPAFMTGFDPLPPLVTFGYIGSANPWNTQVGRRVG
jgi:hypothetical protein